VQHIEVDAVVLEVQKWALMLLVLVHWHVELLGRNIDEDMKDPIVVGQKQLQQQQTKLSQKDSFFMFFLKVLRKFEKFQRKIN
jgi:hypothetical protein